MCQTAIPTVKNAPGETSVWPGPMAESGASGQEAGKSQKDREENRLHHPGRGADSSAQASVEGLLAGLYELPNLEGQADEEEAIAFARELGFSPFCGGTFRREAKHIFSHGMAYDRLHDPGGRHGETGSDRAGNADREEGSGGGRRSPRMATFWWRWRETRNTTRSRRPWRPTPTHNGSSIGMKNNQN